MFLFIFLFSCVRIKEILGEIGNMEYLSGDKLQYFLQSNQMSIIFYSNPDNKSREELSFANSAITIYKEAISFALGDLKAAPAEHCNFKDQANSFCIIAYERSTPHQNNPGPKTASSLLNWIDLISHPQMSPIFSINKLNKLLNGNETCLFAVSVQEDFFENFDIPKEKKIYLVAADLFLIYNLTINQGIYFYRPNDRQILKLDDKNKFDILSSEENMKIQQYETIETDKNKQNRFICGFTLNESDPLLCEEQYKILTSLSKNEKLNEFSSSSNMIDDFNKYFIFTVVKRENIETFTDMTCTKSVSIPYFFVVNVTNPTRLRWIVEKSDFNSTDNHGNRFYNYSYLVSFLNRVYLNQEDPYIVSEFDANRVSQNGNIKKEKNQKFKKEFPHQLNDQNDIKELQPNTRNENTEEALIDLYISQHDQLSIQKIVGKTFTDLVFDDYYECVVLFTRENNTKYKFFKPIVNAAANILKKFNIRFFYIDLSKNDVPTCVPPLKNLPALVIWPAGHKEAPAVYEGNGTIADVLNFVHKNTGHAFAMPRLDLEGVKERLAAILNKIRFGGKE